jgi:protein-disulfide isomerase
MRISLLAVILILVAVGAAGPSRAPAQTPDLKSEQCLGGEPDAPIRVEVFSDFDCPACKQFFLETIRPVLKEYCSVNKVCVVYHEFPLLQHKYSRQAAQYAEAALRLGRKQCIAVMTALFEAQDKWAEDGSVDDVAFKALGADDYFAMKKVLLDPSINAAIDADLAMAQKKEVSATPTFYVYATGREQKVIGYLPYPFLKEYFDKVGK